jgi:hypothetical protein
MFVHSRVVMMNGEGVSPCCDAALSRALTSHVLALHTVEIYDIYLVLTQKLCKHR